jgi:pyridoxal phosphate enzyme (YggS family)
MISENIAKIKSELMHAKLIAVSKTKPLKDIMEAYEMGIRDFGENKVQELLDKKKRLPSDIRWHMIGHLQTNKVKYIIDQAYLIHAVDTVKLAKEIDKQATRKGIRVGILLEVNIALELSKYGFREDQLDDAIREISKLDHVAIQGLMCIAPNVKNPEDNRKYFAHMNKLKKKYSLNILSMGMSNDYKVADEEGSTYVRVGTKIFGER